MSATARSVARAATRPAPVGSAKARHLRTAPDRRRSRRLRLALAAGVLVSGASLFAIVAINVVIAQGQFELADLSDARDEARVHYQQLRLEVAERSSPEKVVSAAAALGMVAPDRVEYISVPDAPKQESDKAADTLDESWEDVKASLGTAP